MNHYIIVAKHLTLPIACVLLLTFVAASSTVLQHTARTPSSGRYRALVVFARFEDDLSEHTNPAPKSIAWADPNMLPDFAGTLLSQHPVPPFREGTLTDYFYHQSNQRFVLYGEAYPNVVVVGPQSNYQDTENHIKLKFLTGEILRCLNGDPGLNLSDFDENDDGFVDHIFIVMRSIEKHSFFGGAAGYASLEYSSTEPEFGTDVSGLKKVHHSLSGSYLRYNSAGIVLPQIDLVRLMAHEFGHNLFPLIDHTQFHLFPIENVNGVPENSSHKSGYALMIGALGAQRNVEDVRGDYTISAFEREWLDDGWIECVMLSEDRQAVRITDLYSSSNGNCFKMVVPAGPNVTRTIYLSNRQRIGFFDRTHQNTGMPSYSAGLQTTGLLVTAAQFTPLYDKASFAVVSADNTLALNDSAHTYQGDLFGPDTKSQLTPWTRPNVAAFTTFPEDITIADAHFQAIDNIRYSGGPNMEMAFDYSTDFRVRPVIREDSWIGRETAGFEFTTDVVVTGGSTLTIETDVRISSRLVIDSGSTVAIDQVGQLTLAESSVLQMAPGSRITGHGELVSEGNIDVDPDAYIDFPVKVEDDKAAETTLLFKLSQNYPNPFNPTTMIRYDLPQAADVTLTVYDVLGRTIRELASGTQPAGTYEVTFDATGFPSGVYFYRLQARDYVETKRMVVVR